MTRLNGIARITAAAALTVASAGLVRADAPGGPRVVGTGENASLEYPTPSQNIVGGALTRTIRSGESSTTEVIEVQRMLPGRLSRVSRSGESAEIIYIDPPLPTALDAGRKISNGSLVRLNRQ